MLKGWQSCHPFNISAPSPHHASLVPRENGIRCNLIDERVEGEYFAFRFFGKLHIDSCASYRATQSMAGAVADLPWCGEGCCWSDRWGQNRPAGKIDIAVRRWHIAEEAHHFPVFPHRESALRSALAERPLRVYCVEKLLQHHFRRNFRVFKPSTELRSSLGACYTRPTFLR